MVGKRAGARIDVSPIHKALAVPLRLARDMAKHPDESLERVLALLHADLAQRPGLIETDVIPGAGEQLRGLRHPVIQHCEHARIDRKSTRLNSSHLVIS